MNSLIKADDIKLSNVTGINKKAFESILPEQQALILNALQPKIKDLPALKVVTDFTTIITTAFTVAGQQSEIKQLALYADEFYQKLLHTYPQITVDEVRAALRSGTYGEYGEYYGLNPKSFLQFVKSYLNSDIRKIAKLEFEEKRMQLSSPSPSEAEVYQNNITFIEILYKDFLQGKLLTDYIPAYLYDFLEKEKLISLDLDAKNKIKERASSYYTRLKTMAKMAGGMAESLNGYYIATDPNLTVKTICKQFAVFDYFEHCKLENKLPITESFNGGLVTD